ncbi:hypothetical protein OU787_27620 [Kitasatospora sp. YST-16]|uniref:hypothetical protein n=1 Tax=unclassified Kitasatospora TaxID=2633591 RepID=UPI000A8F0083|nr:MULTISPECIES: hypothetical protein [unclassified Kitasatospora]WAL74946.1 hypothetical protein OU787_27620 [Kitasatospora sp. YST-16]WNW41002.1 hypothetical protein RKE32_27545 [Streptomyces sp. Li-HN-5-13]
MARSLKKAAALTVGTGLLAVLGMAGTAHAGTTGTVTLEVPGCKGVLYLSGGGSSNWATATLQSNSGRTCWLTFWERNTSTGGQVSQSLSVQNNSSASTGSYYHDATHQVAISISNGVDPQKGSAWYN